MSEFILMLTRDDVTVPDALARLAEVADTGLRHVGFKDVGLPVDEMRRLVSASRDCGANVFLEVVSLSEAEELRSASVAIDLGVDFLIGGTRWESVRPLIEGTGIRYFPYVGEVVGHPAELRGTLESIVTQAERAATLADGVNLLAFRHRSVDPVELVRLVAALSIDVICAGSIDSLERVAAVTHAGAWAFTIGTAVLDGKVVPGLDVAGQVRAVLACASATEENGQSA